MAWTSFIRSAASVEADRMKAQARAAIRSAILGILAGIVLLIGIVFTLAGVYGTLAEHMPDWQAGAWIGLTALILCLLLLMMARRGSRRRPPPPRAAARARRPRAEDLEATAELGAAASTAAGDFVRRHRPTGVELTLAAFIVGMVASRRRPRG